jgi:stage III sporulation protein AB
MELKIGGALLMVISSVILGFYYAAREMLRIKELMEFKKALLILASEIEYTAAPLFEAAANISKRADKPASAFFADFASGLAENSGETVYRLWESAVEKHKRRYSLAEEDWEALLAFGKTLGYLDKKMQLNAIDFTNRYIDEKTAALQVGCDKNKRMYRSLGMLGGVLAAVVLW